MTINNNTEPQQPARMGVMELEEFLMNPPQGFTVERLPTGLRVSSSGEDKLLFLDQQHQDLHFHQNLGRSVKMRNLWEYTSMRKSLLSKRIYLLISACQEFPSATHSKRARGVKVLKQFVVWIDGSDPFIRWQMEKGLDWTIASVAGESYRVDIDLTEAMTEWAEKNMTEELLRVGPVWKGASFTLKYYTDALFDFPHWFGFSKRNFKLRMT